VVYSDISEVTKSLTSMKLEYLPPILFFIAIGVVIKGIRQYYLLRFNDLKISLKESIVIFIAGISLIFTPGGLGELIKTKFFKDGHRMQIRDTAPIVVMEKYHEFLGAITIIAVSILLYNSIEAEITLTIGVIILIIVYLNLRYKKLPQILKRFLIKIKPLQNIIASEEDSKKSFYKLTSASKMFVVWSFTIISMLFELTAIYLIFLSFNLHQFDFILVSQITLTSLILGYLSFLPNGIGITDGSYIGMLAVRKLDLAIATSVVLAIRFIGVWFKVSLGFIALKFLKVEKNN
jgi:uncharacterized protein (TIRG00374 family)